MWSGVIVSSAANAGPGNFTDGVLFAPLEPPAPPSAQASRLAHTSRHAETAFSIPRIDRFLPNKAARPLEACFFEVCVNCKGGYGESYTRTAAFRRTRVQSLPERAARESPQETG